MSLVSDRERLVKALTGYDMSSLYHPGKVNVVTDYLSKLSMGSTAHIEEGKRELAKDVHRLARLGVRLIDSTEGGIEVESGAELSVISSVRSRRVRVRVRVRAWEIREKEEGKKRRNGRSSKEIIVDFIGVLELKPLKLGWFRDGETKRGKLNFGEKGAGASRQPARPNKGSEFSPMGRRA
ncbi:hypothetical protein MTR67_017754 [Solanum verrucosum]|uniref:Uncharacterized protein n=1 Tax=Solanum verrucosum TaxID=315347 RepID=A0AAF0TM46_SOLVR|nr:hypothetical protein MTR67_017754 [Solanum verrucosum]